MPARTTLALEAQAWHRAVCERQQATLFFDAGDPTRPVVMGLLQPAPTPGGAAQPLLAAELPEVKVDGRRVQLRGNQEVELACGETRVRLTQGEVVVQCGESSLRLRRLGEVELQGVDVVTEAKGVQRIRGSKVKIN